MDFCVLGLRLPLWQSALVAFSTCRLRKPLHFRPSTRRSRQVSQFLTIGNFRLEVIYTSFYDPLNC